MSFLKQTLLAYARLMRLDKPIGIYLLLWPTLWTLWIASNGFPDIKLLFIFVIGTILMRSAGCIVNDLTDQRFDKHVRRTKYRPLVTGEVSQHGTFILTFLLCTFAFILVLLTNLFTILLAGIALLVTLIYPFMKRITHLPQGVLGIAFAWGIPMAFAAQTNHIPPAAWLLFLATFLWVIAYDTLYAMVDRTDDLKIGVKSTAILFGKKDRWMIALLQLSTLGLLAWVGSLFDLGITYYLSLLLGSGFFIYQQYLIKDREPKQCFQAFLNNHWFGLTVFLGVVFALL